MNKSGAIVIAIALCAMQVLSQTTSDLNGRWINTTYTGDLKKYRSPKDIEDKTNLFYFDLRNDTICITDDLHTSNYYNVLKNIGSDSINNAYTFSFADDTNKQYIKIFDYLIFSGSS
jgi:hypothetical protein